MDTISRENNSMLPVGSIIVGVVALLLGGFALVQASKANKLLAEHQVKIDKVDGIEQQAANAASAADRSAQNVTKLQTETQKAFDTVLPMITNLQTSVTKLEELSKKPAAAAGKKGAAARDVVAGPDEYLIKKGDVPSTIAKTHGCTVKELQAVNEGVNWSKLAVGQKIKLPVAKK